MEPPTQAPVDDVLDVVEILVEEGPQTWLVEGTGKYQQVNAAFGRHRFGYRIEQGQVLRKGVASCCVPI